MRWLLGLLLIVALASWWMRERVEPPPRAAAPGIPPAAAVENVSAAPPDVAATAGSAPSAAPVAGPALAPATAPAAPPTTPAAERGPMPTFLVVDVDGTPIAAATVTAVDGEHDLATANTDARGEAVLHGAPAPFAFVARAPGFWPVRGTIADPHTTTRVELPRAPLLSGRVFDHAGAPVPGARAALLAPLDGRRGAPQGMPPGAPQAETDASGSFMLSWPDAGAHDLVVAARGFAPAHAALRAWQQGQVTVRLDAGAAVTGTARAPDGTPLVDAAIEVWSPRDDRAAPHTALGPLQPWARGQLLAATRTAADGSFTCGDLPPGTAVVALDAEHGASAQRLNLLPGRTAPAELVAAAPATLRGHVANAPPGCEVFVYGGARFLRTATVAAGGSFEFAAVPPGRYLLGATVPPVAERLAAVVQQFVVDGNTTAAIVVALAPGEDRSVAVPWVAAIAGIVTGTASAGGAPAVDHVVVLESVGGAGALRRETAVGADGTFRLVGVPPGDYDARLRRRGAPATVAEAPCRVRAGDTTAITLVRP